MKTFTRISAVGLLSVLAAMMLTCGVVLSRATTTTKVKNSLGVHPYEENPYIYIAGAVTKARTVGDDENLLLTISPMGTYQLFTEQLQLCGDPVELFNGKTNPLVLTVTRVAFRRVEGRGCHELIRVDNLERQ